MSLMINFDGAIFKEQSTLGVGVFIRDDNWQLIAALSCKGRAILDLEEAELAVVGQAIDFAIGIGARDIILEGDLASSFDKL